MPRCLRAFNKHLCHLSLVCSLMQFVQHAVNKYFLSTYYMPDMLRQAGKVSQKVFHSKNLDNNVNVGEAALGNFRGWLHFNMFICRGVDCAMGPRVFQITTWSLNQRLFKREKIKRWHKLKLCQGILLAHCIQTSQHSFEVLIYCPCLSCRWSKWGLEKLLLSSRKQVLWQLGFSYWSYFISRGGILEKVK